jgi:hypothetical protein
MPFKSIKLQYHSSFLLGILLWLFYFTEAYSKVSELLTGEYSIFPRIVKLLFFSFILFFLLKTNYKMFFWYIILPFLSFCLGQYFLPEGFSKNSIITMGKYLFPISLFLFSTEVLKNNIKKDSLFKVFEWLIIFNSILILLGFIFDIEAFKTYDGSRFGYNGLLLTSATSTYVYIIVLFYFLIKKHQKWYNWKLILVLISIFLIGTKSLYLVLLIIGVLFIYRRIKLKYVWLFILFCIILSGITTYIVFYKIGVFNEIRQKHDLLSSILSYRNHLFLNDTLPFIEKNWSLPNYFFGGVFDIETRSEMGFIDVFYFWGIIGGALYLWAYYKSYFTFKINSFMILFTAILLIIISLAGNFFFYSTIPIYLLILKEKIIQIQDNFGNEISKN